MRFAVLLSLFAFFTNSNQAQTLQELTILDNSYNDCLENGKNMPGCSQIYYNQIDSKLKVAQITLHNSLDQTGKLVLEEEHIKWLEERDAFFQSIDKDHAANNSFQFSGNDSRMLALDEKAQFLKVRAKVLIHKLEKQVIQDIFRSLPIEYTPDLTAEAKDSLIQYGSYTIPGGDSREALKAEYKDGKDYIRLGYFFTTGQTGFFIIELRKFQKPDCSAVVVYSKYGGSRWAYDQHTLLTFDYIKGSLNPNNNYGLPASITTSEFFKEKVPDSVQTEKLILNTSYNLAEEDNTVSYEIHPQNDQYDKWIISKKILFTWNGKRFKKE